MNNKEELAVQELSNVSNSEIEDRKVCFGIRLSSAAIGVGIVYTVGYVFSAVFYSYLATIADKDTFRLCQRNGYYQIGFFLNVVVLITFAILSVLCCLLSIALVVGVMTKRPRLIQPWLVLQWMQLIMLIILYAITIAQSIMYSYGLELIMQLIGGLVHTGIIYSCLNVVNMYYKGAIKESKLINSTIAI